MIDIAALLHREIARTSQIKIMATQPLDIVKHLDMAHEAREVTDAADYAADKAADPEALEVFQQNVDGVEFRTVSWQRAVVVFLKINFAMSILSTPNAIATLGAVGGGLSLVGWIALNTCMLSPSSGWYVEGIELMCVKIRLFSWGCSETTIRNAIVSPRCDCGQQDADNCSAGRYDGLPLGPHWP